MSRYHQILGIPEGASKKEIKLAYRKLAMIWHPDVNNSELAHQKFTEINLAYKKLIQGERIVSKQANATPSKEEIRKERRKAAELKIKKAREEAERKKIMQKIEVLKSPYLWMFKLMFRVSLFVMCFLPVSMVYFLTHAIGFGLEAFLISIVLGAIALYYPIICSYDYYKDFQFLNQTK